MDDILTQLGQESLTVRQGLELVLTHLCRQWHAQAGAILEHDAAGVLVEAAHWPESGRGAAPWIRQEWLRSAGQALHDGKPAAQNLHAPGELYDQPPSNRLIVAPAKADGHVLAVAVVTNRGGDPDTEARELLQSALPLLECLFLKAQLRQRQKALASLQAAITVLDGVLRQDRFLQAAMESCNQLAALLGASRASLGFVKRGAVHLVATSHTEKFDRKTQTVERLEAAMDECLDQDLEVIHPAPADAVYVHRAAAELSGQTDHCAILSLPIRHEGAPFAVVTLQRPAKESFSAAEAQSVRLACELFGPILRRLRESDRWFGAKLTASVARAADTAVGAKHTAMKGIVAAALALIAFGVLVKGTYSVSAPFVVQAQGKQVIPAPFDSVLKAVEVLPGSHVVAGSTPLGQLETNSLDLEIRSVQAEMSARLKQRDLALGQGKVALAEQAQAQADEAKAKIDLLEVKLRQARLVSPSSGTVVSANLKPRVGTAVQKGEVLFEVSALEHLDAELAVSEDQVADLAPGQSGHLITLTRPGQKISCTVQTISPAAEVADKRNVFKVRVRLQESPQWLRPGMEGTARIVIDERSYAWLAGHRLTDWLRLQLWRL